MFARHFEGRLGDKGYFEIAQRFTHVANIHFLAERSAYCRLDDRGDIEDAVRIVEMSKATDKVDGTVVTVKRGLLDEYMALTDSVAVVMFDFTRFQLGDFAGWSGGPTRRSDGDIHYKQLIQPSHASYIRGFQIVRSALTKEDVARRFDPAGRKEGQYASFIAYDWKNRVVREISCAPGHTANYFIDSALPFETSPAFFRPEVLQKYKGDSEKYKLEDRSISCRGTWHLETYDINEVGQVHTYLVYLSRLPYEEQLHWKAYNEPPKAPISERAFKTDFEGSWDVEADPLESLKDLTRDLDRVGVPWWTLRSERALDQLHYPVTASADEWADELLHLDQLIVEGLVERWLRTRAVALSRKPDATLRSLRLLEECLIGLGFEPEHAMEITAPLHEVHSLRSKVKGHASGKEAAAIRKEILSKHGTYAKHFRDLSRRCDESLRGVRESLQREPTGAESE